MNDLMQLAFNGLPGWLGASLVAVSFMTSFITACLGIGGGVLLLAIMASTFPPAALIPVHGVVQLGSNLGRAGMMWRYIHWHPFALFAIGAVVGVLLGGQMVVTLPPAWIQICVGGFILWSVLSRPPALLARWPVVTGAFSSFLTMFIGATGPFVAVFAQALSLPRQDHVATHAACMSLQHLLKSLVFGGLGFAFGPWLTFIALMIGAGALGTAAGRVLLLKMSDQGFQKALNLVLIVLSLRLLWTGIYALSR